MTNEISPIDRKKPDPKQGKRICDGCWTVATENQSRQKGWVVFAFRSLKNVLLCEKCKETHGQDLAFKQSRGL